MKPLIFATRNQHKIKEVNDIIGKTSHTLLKDIQILGLDHIQCFEELPETSQSILGNAKDKARFVFEHYGVDCFAEDTGLIIDALDGRPGVDTAHYAGPERDAEKNMQLVLQQMVGMKIRSARFKTAIALYLHEKLHVFEGFVEGTILQQLSGSDGFGYDPIFAPAESHRSFAQMTSTEKNQISHRYRALMKMLDFLRESA